MRSIAAASVVLGALAVLGGCKPEPSWAARWRIAPRPEMVVEPTTTDDEDALINSIECSRVGVSAIDFRTVVPLEAGEETLPAIAIEGLFADDRDKPCWAHSLGKPDRVFGGPTLPAGEYELVTMALRSNGFRWCAPELTQDCNPESFDADVQSACNLVLAPPGKCDSGVHVRPLVGQSEDQTECIPPCQADQVWSFADGCFAGCVPEAECNYCNDPFWTPRCWEGERCHPSYLSCDCHSFTVVDDETTQITDIVLEAPPECEDGIDGDGDGLVDARDPGCLAADAEGVDIVTSQLVLDFTLLSGNEAASCVGVHASRFEISIDGQVVSVPPCEVGPVGVDLQLAPGLHEVSARALAFDGEPVTRAKTYALEAIVGGVLRPQRLEVDFADVDFLEPIETAARFVVAYVAADGVPPRYCKAANGIEAGAPGRLDIGDVTVRFFDAAGDPVEPAPLVEIGDELIEGLRLDGSPMPCTQQPIRTNALRWGAYRVEVEAFSPEGDLCFSNVGAPTLLAPEVAIEVDVPRVLPLAPSCRDCSGDEICGTGYRCDEGICVPQ